MNEEIILQTLANFIWNVGPKIVYALIVLILGFWISGILGKVVRKTLVKRHTDVSLAFFLGAFVKTGLRVLVVISAISMLGIATTSFVAVIGAAGLAVGLALQGSLANFAGGVLILLLKPFKVGEFVEASGVSGTVEKIEIFYTHIRKLDNVLYIIPNGKLSNDQVTNYSRLEQRRCDLVIGISYDDDIKKAQKVLKDLVKKDKRILKDPEPFVRVTELADSSVNFTVRIWAETSVFWDVRHDFIENVKLRFDKEGINFPFPQLSVHMEK